MPLTNFRNGQEAVEYANAYAKALKPLMKKKQKLFFGDPDFWKDPKKEWTEDYLPRGSGFTRGVDPMNKHLRESIPNRWIGGI